MNRQTTVTLLKLTAGLSLFTGIIAFIFLIFLPARELSNKTTPTPIVSVTPTTSSSPTNNEKGEGEMCGGIAGFQCANGYRCKFTCPNGSVCDDSQYPYPDAGGTCVKK